MDYMLSVNEEQIATEWQKYQNYTVRPVPSLVDYYQEIISAYADKQDFMLYGGTPEIRSIFQNLKLKLTITDRSEKMVRALGLLTDEHQAFGNKEYFVNLNWLEVQNIKTKFDLIIGDDAINMVDWDFFEVFLQNAHSILKKEGLFICHLLVKPDDKLIQQSFAEIFSEYKNGDIKNNFDLASRLNFICYDPLTYKMGWQKTITTIGENNLNKLKPDFDFIKTFGLCNSQFSCPPINKFEKLVTKYFLIKHVFYPHEFDYCQFEPLYLLIKK